MAKEDEGFDLDGMLGIGKGDYSDPDDETAPFHGEAGGIKSESEAAETSAPEPPAPAPDPEPEQPELPVEEPEAPETTPVPVEEPEPQQAAESEEWAKQRNALVAERQKAKEEARKLREELAILRSQQGPMVTPQAAPGASPQQSPQPGAAAGVPAEQGPGQPPGIPVQVSEDGQHVYVDPAAIQAEVEKRTAPPPGAMAHAAGIQTFMASQAPGPDYTQAAETVQRVQQVDNWLGQRLSGLARQGFRPQSPQQVTEVLKSVGAFEEISQTFPEIMPHVDAFMSSMASPDPNFRAMVLRQIHADRMASQAAPEELQPAPPQPNGAPPPPPVQNANTPPSMARNGGTRSPDNSPKRKEFEALEKAYFANPNMPKAEYQRYIALGRDLGEEGFEAMGPSR